MIKYIEVSRIKPHPDNPRKDLGDLTELTESIKANGILQNLTVVPHIGEVTGEPLENGYVAVIGHRRLAAAKLAGLTEVPCVVSDMKHREQVGIMLTENIQRSDLTVFEQAQGFQMMLNFGDSVGDISKRTGFSETTVRRRVKLLELDQDKLKKSMGRGATLTDYVELEKIKDVELRNSVLEKIGTPNFKWALDKAVGDEAIAENKAKLIAQLEKFATRTENSSGMRYVKGYYPSRDGAVTVPDDAETTKYFFVVSNYGGIDLYAKYEQGGGTVVQDERDKEALAKDRVRRETLAEITKRAYKLRGDFIRGISNAKAKSHMNAIIEYSLRGMLDGCSGADCDDFVDFLGADKFGIGEEDEFEFGDIAGFIREQPERCLLVAAYLTLDSQHHSYYTWQGEHKDDDDLNAVYDFLEELGYMMSDEEYMLSNGTHELFGRDDGDGKG